MEMGIGIGIGNSSIGRKWE